MLPDAGTIRGRTTTARHAVRLYCMPGEIPFIYNAPCIHLKGWSEDPCIQFSRFTADSGFIPASSSHSQEMMSRCQEQAIMGSRLPGKNIISPSQRACIQRVRCNFGEKRKINIKIFLRDDVIYCGVLALVNAKMKTSQNFAPEAALWRIPFTGGEQAQYDFSGRSVGKTGAQAWWNFSARSWCSNSVALTGNERDFFVSDRFKTGGAKDQGDSNRLLENRLFHFSPFVTWLFPFGHTGFPLEVHSAFVKNTQPLFQGHTAFLPRARRLTIKATQPFSHRHTLLA